MEDRRDRFWILFACSAAAHLIVLVLLPSLPDTGGDGYVERAIEFDGRSGGATAAMPPVWSDVLPVPEALALGDAVGGGMQEAPAVPAPPLPDAGSVEETKPRLADNVGRNAVRPRRQVIPFREVVERRISDSFEKHMGNSVRLAGIDRVVVLTVTILPSGEVESVDVERSSEIALVDEASVKAVKLAAPFPGFPKGLGLPRLKLRVPIRYTLAGEVK
jgi:TonB family protein